MLHSSVFPAILDMQIHTFIILRILINLYLLFTYGIVAIQGLLVSCSVVYLNY